MCRLHRVLLLTTAVAEQMMTRIWAVHLGTPILVWWRAFAEDAL